MTMALAEAAQAAEHGDVPVGAIAIAGGRVVGRGHNRREADGDPTAHAELLALREAAAALGRWRLDDVTLVVTLEPCPMCAGALVAGRVARVVFAAAHPKAGACGSLYNVCVDPRLNHEVAVAGGWEAEAGAALLTDFFTGFRGDGPAGCRPRPRPPCSPSSSPASGLSGSPADPPTLPGRDHEPTADQGTDAEPGHAEAGHQDDHGREVEGKELPQLGNGEHEDEGADHGDGEAVTADRHRPFEDHQHA